MHVGTCVCVPLTTRNHCNFTEYIWIFGMCTHSDIEIFFVFFFALCCRTFIVKLSVGRTLSILCTQNTMRKKNKQKTSQCRCVCLGEYEYIFRSTHTHTHTYKFLPYFQIKIEIAIFL